MRQPDASAILAIPSIDYADNYCRRYCAIRFRWPDMTTGFIHIIDKACRTHKVVAGDCMYTRNARPLLSGADFDKRGISLLSPLLFSTRPRLRTSASCAAFLHNSRPHTAGFRPAAAITRIMLAEPRTYFDVPAHEWPTAMPPGLEPPHAATRLFIFFERAHESFLLHANFNARRRK